MEGLLMDRESQLTICSLEDEPDTIRGSLDSLEFEGHRVEQCENLGSARELLSVSQVDLLLLDEHVSGDDKAGTKLITELKRGGLGPQNVNVPFGFVTASRAWVDESEVRLLPGYLGIEIKGSDLTRALKRWTGDLIQGPTELRRVPICVEGVETDDEQGARLVLSVPAWDSQEKVRLPIEKVPDNILPEVDRLEGRWFIAKMNLQESDPSRITIRDWEWQEPLDDADGLA